MAVLTKAQKTVLTDKAARSRQKMVYLGLGGQAHDDAAQVASDYDTLFDLLTSVKADAAYASLAGALKTSITNAGF